MAGGVYRNEYPCIHRANIPNLSERVSLTQDKFEWESWVGELTLQTRNAVTEHVRNGAVLTDGTLECELMQQMDDVFEPVMRGRRVCDISKEFAFSEPPCFNLP